MRSRFSLLALAAAIVAAPAFAQNEPPAGRWDGVLVRNGAQAPISMNLTEEGGIWRGRLVVDGTSSPLDDLSVTGNSVHFALPGRGVFDAMFSGDSMTGSVASSNSNGSFALTREESDDAYGDAIESSGP